MATKFMRTIPALAGVLLASSLEAAGSPPPPPLTAYGNLPAIQDAAISPSGKNVAIVINTGAKALIDLIDGNHRVVGQYYVDDKVRGITFFGDDAALLETSQTEHFPVGYVGTKFELSVGRIIKLDGSEPQVVFGRNREMLGSIFGDYGVRRVEGQWYGYFGGMQLTNDGYGHYNIDSGQIALYRVDAATDNPRQAASAAPSQHSMDWLLDQSGKVSATLDIAPNGAWAITNARGNAIAGGMQKKGAVSMVAFGKDGNTVIYRALDPQSNITHWYEVPIAGGAAKEIYSNEPFDQIFYDHANSRMIGYLPTGKDDSPVFFDPVKQAAAKRVIGAFPGERVQFVDWSTDFSKMLVQTSGNRDSGSWYVIDTNTLQKVRLGQDRGQIGPDMVGPVSTFQYKAADGLAMNGILTLPPGREAKNLPAIMLPHGGPASEDVEAFDWWAQAFASRGYAVFQPNFRGSTNMGDKFELAGNGEWGRKMQTDISDGLNALAKAGIIDPKRVCIVGASYGGYAALAGVTLQHGIYKCSVAVAGISDVKALEDSEYWQSGNSKMLERNLLAMLGSKDNYDDISPIKHVKDTDAPILLIHGRDDTVVEWSQSSDMADALKDAGKPYEFVELKNEDHWLSRSETRNQMLAATVAFVQKYNPAD